MPLVETGPESRIRFTNIIPPTLLIVQPRPCPICLWIVSRFSPPVSFVLFLLSGSVSSSFNSLSLAVWMERIHSSLCKSVLQQNVNVLSSAVKLKQKFFFLDSYFSMALISMTKIRSSAVRPRFSSSSFLKTHNIARFRTTYFVRHCRRTLDFFCRVPCLIIRFFTCILFSAILQRESYATYKGWDAWGWARAENTPFMWKWCAFPPPLLCPFRVSFPEL